MIVSSLQDKKHSRAKQNKEFILELRTPCPLLLVIERNSRFKPRDTLSQSQSWWTFSGNDSNAGSSLNRARTRAHTKEKYCKKLEGKHRWMYPTEKKNRLKMPDWWKNTCGSWIAVHGLESSHSYYRKKRKLQCLWGRTRASLGLEGLLCDGRQSQGLFSVVVYTLADIRDAKVLNNTDQI